MKSALFVDFDNVYSGLRRLDQETADQFARNPTIWMNWLINSLEMPEPVTPGAKRRVLVRRCYLNPQAYQRFRPSFNLAGFEIIDCPSLTSEGKTSTDIHMVLDIVELLQYETHYDEFIVFSADADFTPVLRKLRRWDRRTTVLAIGFPSAAYRASADLLIDQDDFVRNALSFKETIAPHVTEVATSLSSVECGLIALTLIKQAVEDATAPLSLSKVASKLLKEIDGLDASSWAGFGSFRSLLESLDLTPLVVSWDSGGTIHDPKRHLLSSTQSSSVDNVKDTVLLNTFAEAIKAEVTKASQPIPCGQLATMLIGLNSSLATDWAGKGTFRKFVESLDIKHIAFTWDNSGGIAYDANRQPSSVTKPSEIDIGWADKNLFKIAKQIHDVTDVPLLPPKKYQNLLAMIAADIAETPFNLMGTGKSVRDRCKDSGLPISRDDVNRVLRGLIISGHLFDEGPNDAATLAQKLGNNIRSLCLREQIVLDEQTDKAIKDWISYN
jgi:hypothetical protein